MGYQILQRDSNGDPSDNATGRRYDELLKGHVKQCQQTPSSAAISIAGRRFNAGERKLGGKLFEPMTDWRNLRSAWDHLVQNGGHAIGPDGQSYEDYADRERDSLLAAVSQSLKTERYRPGPERTIRVPKASGVGERPIVLQNISDRVVARAVAQVLQPFASRWFQPTTFCCRAESNPRWQALHSAGKRAKNDDRWIWTTADIRDAFTKVPHGRLMDVVRQLPLSDKLVRLIQVIIDNPQGKGLRQGNPLSPLLLDLYLDHFLDHPWRVGNLGCPFIRYVDDFLILSNGVSDADRSFRCLNQRLLAAGLPLKLSHGSIEEELAVSSVNLAAEGVDFVSWLGYRISAVNPRLQIGIAEAAWVGLQKTLSELRGSRDASIRAASSVEQWLVQMAPAYQSGRSKIVIDQIYQIGEHLGFEELPSRRELLSRWKWQSFRYHTLRRLGS